jgi:CheY-like chemotaxis protein
MTVSAPEGISPSAIVVAGDEETRVLLRGLLRLHHFRVDGEAEGATQALELIKEHRPNLVVADVTLTEGSAGTLVAETRRLLPDTRIVLVAPASRPPPPNPDPSRAPHVVLLRPFRIRQFAEALLPGGATTAPS